MKYIRIYVQHTYIQCLSIIVLIGINHNGELSLFPHVFYMLQT